MQKNMGLLPFPLIVLVAILGLTLTTTIPTARAEFSEAELFFELNDTDGDLGIHASIDGDAYKTLEIKGPDRRRILLLRAFGQLVRQGLTQFFLESAEPSFDELDPADFFARFPEGEYTIMATTLEKEKIEGTVDLSHVLAAPVGNITVNLQPVAEDCDAVLLPMVAEPVVIDWDPAMTSHPDIGAAGPVVIDRYQFFVEQGDLKLAIDLPSSVTEFQVPASITALGGVFKFEIIARTTTGNNTAIETCYMVP